jgi:hypothetical protein
VGSSCADQRNMPATAWPSDFPSGWPTPIAAIEEAPAETDRDDLYGWSVVDFDVPTAAGWAEDNLETGAP